ncbi:tryptophan 7-halogenase [Nostocaceae cyanobacterium CENA369]|uniref:Tryptophan 7-halogenase n=1 Tax=Dendronalium phyllosphericum CENA369 TaxID=1725256 RepID=A0A8J7LHU1_9NOST|nr:tryptophan 7-halogenase [Dendronalium phyllosphericum CENA369]
MPIVEVWLGLLLGSFTLQQREDFYSDRNVWVIANFWYLAISWSGKSTCITKFSLYARTQSFLSHHYSNLCPTPKLIDATNRYIADLWDKICDFLTIHFKFNHRLDTPFWKHCQE